MKNHLNNIFSFIADNPSIIISLILSVVFYFVLRKILKKYVESYKDDTIERHFESTIESTFDSTTSEDLSSSTQNRKEKRFAIINADISAEMASKIANQRQSKIVSHLENERNVEDKRCFLEHPYEEDEFYYRRYKYENDFLAELSRLKWQLSNTQFLLAERVVDLLITFIPFNYEPYHYWYKRYHEHWYNRYYEYWYNRLGLEGNFPIIKIKKISNAKSGIYPWKVILQFPSKFQINNERNLYNLRRYLDEYKDWLGIRIDIVLSNSTIKEYSQNCYTKDCSNGLIGGTVKTNSSLTYGITSKHVIPLGCNKSVDEIDWPTFKPDITLLKTPLDCFKNIDRITSPCFPATSQMVDKYMVERTSISLKHDSSESPDGYIVSRVIAFPVNGKFYRFPHITVRPKIKSYWGGLFCIPRKSTPFSKPGQSGGWVFTNTTDKWVGKIVAGDEFNGETYLIEAEPLADYISRLSIFNNNFITGSIQFNTWSKK